MADLATTRSGHAARPVDDGLTAARRRRLSLGASARWLPVGILLAVLMSWEALSRAGVISSILFPAPSVVARTLWESIVDGVLPSHLAATLLRVIPGLALGGLAGMLLGLAMGMSRRLRLAIDPFVAAIHPMPKITLLPLLMILFGIGEASKILVVAIAAFFPMVINTMAGVRQISPLYFEVAESYGASRRKIFSRVILPGSMPMTLSGVRLSANVAFLLTIVVEILGAERGLGALIWLSWEILRLDLLYAAMAVTAVVGLGINMGLYRLAARIVPWQVDREPSR